MDRASAVLRWDDVRIGLAINDRDADRAGAWFSVGDVDTLERELDVKGLGPEVIDEQDHDGKPYREFSVRAPHGVLVCITHPLEPEGHTGHGPRRHGGEIPPHSREG